MLPIEKMPRPQPSPASSGVFGWRLRADSPRSLVTYGLRVVWWSPADLRGISGYRVYLDGENNLVQTVSAVYTPKGKNLVGALSQGMHFADLKLAPATNHVVFVSAVTSLGRESPKIPVYLSGPQFIQPPQTTSSPTTTSTTFGPIPGPGAPGEMSATVQGNGHDFLIMVSVSVTLSGPNSLGATVQFQIFKDGVGVSEIAQTPTTVPGLYVSLSFNWEDPNVWGQHTYAVYWCVSAQNATPPYITATLNGLNRQMQVVEQA